MSTPTSISVADLHSLLQADPNRVIVDVREVWELERASLPGVRHYPLSAYGEWQDHIGQDLPRDQPIYVLCDHGIRSAQMAQWLCTQGFRELVNIEGGIDAWARYADPQVGVY